jgi:multidrug resistance efflux pump
MEQHRPEPIVTPTSQRLADLGQRMLPAVVWASCAITVAAMLLGRANRLEYLGLAQALDYPISPVATGTVESVVVQLYDRVNAGELVAKLDDSQVQASVAVSHATLRQLQAELEATRVALVADGDQGGGNRAAILRRFKVDEEQRRLDVLTLKLEVESKEIELERLGIETERTRELWEAGVVAKNVFDTARLGRDAVRQVLDDSRTLLAQTEQEYLAAQERREEYEAGLPRDKMLDSMLQPLRAAIEVEGRRLDEIEIQRRALLLRSPVDGQVSQVLCRRGQAVVPGQPVVVVSEDAVREIVAYLAEDDGREIVPSTRVVVSTRGAGGTVAESVVLRVGPTIQELPPRLWRNPRVPDYGRAVVVAAAPGMQLTPGEMVNVKLLRAP